MGKKKGHPVDHQERGRPKRCYKTVQKHREKDESEVPQEQRDVGQPSTHAPLAFWCLHRTGPRDQGKLGQKKKRGLPLISVGSKDQ